MANIRTFATEAKRDEREGAGTPHFRSSPVYHPLHVDKHVNHARTPQEAGGPAPVQLHVKLKSDDFFLPMVNTIWSKEQLEERCRQEGQPVHIPQTRWDKMVHWSVKKFLYRGFNWISGYNYENPSPRACEYRLIVLESIAGVPGMVAGVFRHFSSLRSLRRDHGWIHTLLEEAQNERMHLLVCMKMFDAGILTRLAVILSQYIMVGALSLVYVVRPQAVHRFVGYLEETAVVTYTSLIEKTKTPGTHLYRSWSNLKAPQMAKAYWNLPDDAMWVDVLENICADETHHRDVNHTFADLDPRDPSPFTEESVRNLENFWQRDLHKWKHTGRQ